MRKHGGTPSRRDKCVTPAAISPPGAAQGRFLEGHRRGLAGCKPHPLFKRRASSCLSQRQRNQKPSGASPRPSAPTYLPTCVCLCAPSPCTPRMLAGLCGAGVCTSVQVSSAPPFLAGVLGCVCLRARSACTPQIPAGLLGACVGVQILAFTPPNPAAVSGCVCLFACSPFTPPVLNEVRGFGVCACVRVSAVKPVRTPVAILVSLGVCIYVQASRHWPISYCPIHLT